MHQRSSTYPYQHSRSSSNHGTSSAFSPNANPNEDWTKISDLAERRRIQNRIAQRNYRKKLKRRLEDLERRAASSSASPEQSHEEPEPPKMIQKTRTRTRASKSTSEVNSRSSTERPSSYDYYGAPEERGSTSMFSHQCTRQLSASPPPVFSYSSYPHLDHYGQPSYGHSPVYNAIPGSYQDLSFQNDYPDTIPSILPSASGPVKRAPGYGDEDIMSPFSLSYANMAGIDLCSPQPLSEASLPVPSLSQTYHGDHSSPSTPPAASSIITCPLTPESDPCSPHSYPAIL